MQLGLCLPQLGGHVDRDGLRAFCEQAEELGYGSLWVQEHIFYPLNPVSGYSARPGLKVPDPYRSTLAALETLTAAAAWTTRPLVGTSILVAGLHRPVALAQRLSTIDLLSGGRLVAGFSVGWSDEEHRAMDVDPRTRGARCDELVDAVVACWGTDPVRFDGRFFTIPEAEVKPKPVQRPRPRLLSGMRSAAGLRRTAAKFDIWNPASGPLEQHLEILGQLNEMRPAGRPPLELYRRLFTTPPVEVANLRTRGVDELCEEVARSRAAGAGAVIIDTNFDQALDSARSWAQVPRTLAPLLDAAALPPRPASQVGGPGVRVPAVPRRHGPGTRGDGVPGAARGTTRPAGPAGGARGGQRTRRAAGGRQGRAAGSAGKQITTGKEKTSGTFFLYRGQKIYLIRKIYR